MSDGNKQLQTGDSAPDFTLPDHSGTELTLSSFREKWVVLYFYPRDNTPGCTTEAIDFTAALDEFKEAGAEILGVSPDSPRKHVNFIDKHNLKITLLSDPDREVLKTYGAWGIKKMYGRESEGVIRSTFLIDPDGKIAHVWRKVRVKGHVQKVKEQLDSLRTG